MSTPDWVSQFWKMLELSPKISQDHLLVKEKIYFRQREKHRLKTEALANRVLSRNRSYFNLVTG